ncbi:beta-lactamase-like [Bradysia coprophila]|uniref:beta-lactamase-like n=1 Tax=Bradysia coprophila TaxID=38358 RepID=UPI00187DB919|nr:beta-lactamase-like [Bradysia coprophila]
MASVCSEFILFVILLVRCVHCSENETVKSAENSDIIPRARQLVNDFLNKTENEFVPGLVISVSVKGEQKWLEAFGKANIENNITMTGDSVMQIGSITKSFIVGLASRLMQENELDFDVPIRKYLSVNQFPDKTWNGSVVNITLRQLFQMTAGIQSLDEDLVGKCLRCKKQIEHLIFMRDKELKFEPGTNFSYSNFGYELAGAVIESVLENKTLDAAVKEMIDNVLKLNKTGMVDSHAITPHIASFYTINNGSLSNSGMWGDIFLNELHAAGGIMTTMTDLVTYGQIWLDAFYGRSEQFLKQSSVRSAWTPSDMSPIFYSMGWVIQNNISVDRRSGNQVVWHDGGA